MTGAASIRRHIELPEPRYGWPHPWLNVFELARALPTSKWTLVGGLMVQAHALSFDTRVLPFDLSAARVLANYRVPEHAPFDDASIAAVAQSAGMTVSTRNARHFEPLGVACLDPWK